MESILDGLATSEVPRLRLGVGGDPPPPAEELVDFVLAPFTADERPQAAEMIESAAEACESWLAEGMQTTMNRFNRS